MWTTTLLKKKKKPGIHPLLTLKHYLSSSSSSSPTSDTNFITLKSQLLNAKKLSRGLNSNNGGCNVNRTAFNGLVVTLFGSGGFLARHLIPLLTGAGCQVVLAYRPGKQRSRPADARVGGDLGQVVRSVPVDLRNEASLRRAMAGSSVVINAVGGHHLETPNFSFEDVHVTGAVSIAKTAQSLGIHRLVHLSALNSSLEPPEAGFVVGGSALLKAKARGEAAVKDVLPSATIFRPADMYGPQDSFLWYYCSNGASGHSHRRPYDRLPLVNGGRGITKTPVAVGDVARGILALVTSRADDRLDGAVVDAVGPRRYEQRHLLTYLQQLVCGGSEEYFPSADLLQSGFRVTNLNYDPLFCTRISLLTWLAKVGVFRDSSHAVVTWETIEREAVSDQPVQEGHLSLRELGIELSHIEELWPTYLAGWRRMAKGRAGLNVEQSKLRREQVELPPYIANG